MLYPAELPKYIKDNTTSFCLLLRNLASCLGERRSIQLSYIRIYQYFTTKERLLLRKMTSRLGGEPSILLRYWDILKNLFNFI